MAAGSARHQCGVPDSDAVAAPTRTGTTAAGRVRGRAPASQSLNPVGTSAFVTVQVCHAPRTTQRSSRILIS